NLTPNVFTLVATFREDQQHCPAGLDRLGDLVVERTARSHIARRDPARHAAPLQFVNDFKCSRPVFADMANKHEKIGVGHGPKAAAEMACYATRRALRRT